MSQIHISSYREDAKKGIASAKLQNNLHYLQDRLGKGGYESVEFNGRPGDEATGEKVPPEKPGSPRYHPGRAR